MRSNHQKLLISAIFAFAMSYLEATIVVYLRELYYPNGFQFPLVSMSSFILFTEVGREAATIVMLSTVAYLIATNAKSTFAFFCFNFGVWDIGYYIWLKILLGWPVTLLDWDVLFLIPLPWIGPVLAPMIVSIALIIAGYYILKYEDLRLSRLDWLLEIFAGILIILSFLGQTGRISRSESPENYPWWLFALAVILGLSVFFRRLIQVVKKHRSLLNDQKNNL